jgi:SsrA-binding protein
LRGSYAKFIDSELWLFNCHIAEYKFANRFNHQPDRARKLLLNRYEMDRLELELAKTRQTLVASKIFFKGNFAKVVLHVADGKDKGDKRASLKRRQQDEDIKRAIKDF